jgi:hypothetical protein
VAGHQAVFWGVVLATLVTFPLTFGWFRFEHRPATIDDYTSFVAGLELASFDATSWFGWLVFHILDIAAVLVIAGASYFLWRRLRDRELTADAAEACRLIESRQAVGHVLLTCEVPAVVSFRRAYLGGGGTKQSVGVPVGDVATPMSPVPWMCTRTAPA